MIDLEQLKEIETVIRERFLLSSCILSNKPQLNLIIGDEISIERKQQIAEFCQTELEKRYDNHYSFDVAGRFGTATPNNKNNNSTIFVYKEI